MNRWVLAGIGLVLGYIVLRWFLGRGAARQTLPSYVVRPGTFADRLGFDRTDGGGVKSFVADPYPNTDPVADPTLGGVIDPADLGKLWG